MRLQEVVGIVANLIGLALILLTGDILIIVGGIILLVLANIAVKLFNMYRLDPHERQEYREQGGSGIWC